MARRQLLQYLRRSLAPLLLAATPGWCAQQAPQQQSAATEAKTPQQQPASNTDSPEQDDTSTLFPHSESSRYWLSGQVNVILQGHPSFSSPYQGPHSLEARGEADVSRVLTLYTGVELTPWAEVLFDVESAGGRGISNAFGLAGYTNLDVVRNPELGSTPYVARGMLHFVAGLGSERVGAERGPLSLFRSLPARRIEFRVGRFSLADFFDVNSAGGDSHLQFLNWTIDNNAAYDYAADTRGYAVGAMISYEDRRWSLRFAETLMPRVANGIDFQWNLERARAENVELELRPEILAKRITTVRLLSYVNHANMGSYREAIAQFEAGETAVPDVTNHPLTTSVKYGFGANLEQAITRDVTAFARFGWDEGRRESFVYTEANQTVSFGAVAHGRAWRRKDDRIGGAFTSNALSGDHRRYLALGGLGFLLGDGRLNYGREKIAEFFYTLHVWRGTFLSADFQHINNPGYNRDRGPVFVPTLRLHFEL